MNCIYLLIIEECQCERMSDGGVDNTTIGHCNELSAHICRHYPSIKGFCLMNDYLIGSRLISIWLGGMSKVCYRLVRMEVWNINTVPSL